MTKPLALLLLLAPALAAADECKHEDRRLLEPSLDGVAKVRFEVNSHDLVLRGGDGAGARLDVRACASDPDYLPQLVVDARRDGDTLVVAIERQGQSVGVFFRPTYAWLEVEATLPAGLAASLGVNAGDRVKVTQGSGSAVLVGDIDASLPPNAVRVPAAHELTAGLGAMFGAIEIAKAGEGV